MTLILYDDISLTKDRCKCLKRWYFQLGTRIHMLLCANGCFWKLQSRQHYLFLFFFSFFNKHMKEIIISQSSQVIPFKSVLVSPNYEYHPSITRRSVIVFVQLLPRILCKKKTKQQQNKWIKTKLKFHTYFVDLSSEWLVTFCVKTRVTTKKIIIVCGKFSLVGVVCHLVSCAVQTYFPSTSILWFVLRGLWGRNCFRFLLLLNWLSLSLSWLSFIGVCRVVSWSFLIVPEDKYWKSVIYLDSFSSIHPSIFPSVHN